MLLELPFHVSNGCKTDLHTVMFHLSLLLKCPVSNFLVLMSAKILTGTPSGNFLHVMCMLHATFMHV